MSSFHKLVDTNGRAWYSFLMVARWLGFRLDLECALILIITSLVAVVVRENSDVDVGLLGFALVYVLGLSGLFQWTVRQSAEVETQMVSIERIAEYAKLPPEFGYRSSSYLPAKARKIENENIYTKIDMCDTKESTVFSKTAATCEGIATDKKLGAVDIRNLTVRYREDLEPVLSDICLSFSAGSKVGICGRTVQ